LRAPAPLTLPLLGAEGGRDPWLAAEVGAKRRAFLVCGFLLFSALAGCSTTAPRTPPAATPVVQGDQPEPPTPGIKPLTVEQEEQFGSE